MGINVNMDYSGLFNSLGSNSTGLNSSFNSLAGLLSDYNQIRSGTYRQTVKAYFAKVVNQDDDASSSKTDKSSSKSKTATTEMSAEAKSYSKLADNAKKLGESADDLISANSSSAVFKNYDADKAYSAVKDFVDNYNKVYTGASGATDSNLQTRAKFMNSVTGNYEKSLAAIGITKGNDGKLTIDEEAFKKAGVSDVKKAFTGTNGYAAAISSSANLIDSSATRAASSSGSYTSSATFASNYSSIMNAFI